MVRAWDVACGVVCVGLGVIGIYRVQFTDFGADDEQHQLSEAFVLGEVVRTVGDARMRYTDSSVWHDIRTSPEDFEQGDAVFTASTGFASIRYRDYEAAQVFPNSLVVLTVGTRSDSAARSIDKIPVLDTKKGKIHVELKGGFKSPRLRLLRKDYDFRRKAEAPDGNIELEIVSRGSSPHVEIVSSTDVDITIQDVGSQGGGAQPKQVHLGPDSKYRSDQPNLERLESFKDVAKTQEKETEKKEVKDLASPLPSPQVSEDSSRLVKAKDFKSEQKDAKLFVEETSKLKGNEKAVPDQDQMEQEILKSLNARLKKAGFNSKVDK